MQLSTIAYFTSVPDGGVPSIVSVLHRHAASALGVEGNARVPIDVALGSASLLDHAVTLAVAGAGWNATIQARPAYAVDLRWTDGTDVVMALERAAALIGDLAQIGALDFAVAHGVDSDAAPGDSGALRDRVIARSATYPRTGPVGLGYLTAFGPRLLGVMPYSAREALTTAAGARPIHGGVMVGGIEFVTTDAGRDQRRALDEELKRAGLLARPHDRTYVPGARWQPLPETWPRAQPSPDTAEAALRSLKQSDPDEPAVDITVEHLVAPFTILDDVCAEGIELEEAVLAYASMAGAQFTDAGFTRADLRGIHAPGARWTDVGMVASDLRWAYLQEAEFPDTRLDEADCSYAILTDVANLESAQGARFDHVEAERWRPGPRSTLAGASFRGAVLRRSDFEGVDLEDAVFEAADLEGVSFRRAILRRARFKDCVLDGTDFTDAILDGTTFDPPFALGPDGKR